MRAFDLVPFGQNAPADMTGLVRTERHVRSRPEDVAQRALAGDRKAA